MGQQLVVVGGGPGSMAAALSAYENGIRDITILEREHRLGGILNQCIHDGFGLIQFGSMISGPEYAARYARMLAETSVNVETDTMVTDIAPDRTVTASGRRGIRQYRPGAIVLATGCRERTRGAIAIPGTRPAVIFTAGVVQNLVNCRNIRVGNRGVILGSGDIGLIMARRLTYEGAKVLAVIELQAEPGGLQRNVSQCLYDLGIPLYTRHTVTEIRGKERVESVVMSAVDDSGKPIAGTEREIACDTLVLSVGLIPENDLAQKAGVRLDQRTNGVLADEYLQTNIAGVFACGNAKAVMDLVDYVSQEGVLAGKNAARFLRGEPMEKRARSYANPMAKGLPKEGSTTCILCPNGCQLEWKDGGIAGNRCPRGAEFGRQEREAPVRSVTTVVLTEDGTLLPVRTDKPVPKDMVFEVIDFCRRQAVAVAHPLNSIVFENVLDTGANVIACADLIVCRDNYDG